MLEGNDTLLEFYGGPDDPWIASRLRCQEENAVTLDTYRAAVRAALVEDIAAKVEAMQTYRLARNTEMLVDRGEVLEIIRGLAAHVGNTK